MAGAERNGGLGPPWDAVDSMLASASLRGILAHKLGPLAANRLRRAGEPVPAPLALEERAATFAMLTAIPLIEKIRANCDGPLVLIKGPEVARLYPGSARRFGDVDLLVEDPGFLQRSLVAHGFVESYDPDADAPPDHHHMPPLQWPTAGLKVEIHGSPNWPRRVRRPPLAEILEASVPSTLGIAEVTAPAPLHHTLILVCHAWSHEPLWTLRDLVDIAAVSAHVDDRELERLAKTWGISRIWRTTRRTIDALFVDGKETVPLRVWARHLEAVRDRTGFEKHVARLLQGYWAHPPHTATMLSMRALDDMFSPAAGESWGHKVRRVPQALRNLRAPVQRDG